MEGFLHAVSSVTIILLLTATGYFCAARGWMGPQAKAFIGKFTLSVAIPCLPTSSDRIVMTTVPSSGTSRKLPD